MSSTAAPSNTDEAFSNNLLDVFGPAVVAPIVAGLFIGSAPFARIATFAVLHATITVVFPLALWNIARRGSKGYLRTERLWYLAESAVSASLPWMIAPEPRWSHYALGLIFAAMTASDTLTVALRPDHQWKPILAVITTSHVAYLGLQGAWVVAAFCLAFGLHLAGGHNAIQLLVLRLRQEVNQSNSLAETDPLTGLENRRGLGRFLEMSKNGPAESMLAVAVDIDDFKQINDRFGHHGGDAALVHLAQHMTDSLGTDWLVARSGGDEFICATERGTISQAREALLTVPTLVFEDSLIVLRVSVGVASGPADQGLLADASAALRLSKRSGKHRLTEVDERLREELQTARRLGAQLADAVQNREIEIWAQPIVHMNGPESGTVHSYECLARWATPEGESVPPSTFIPLIEDQRLSSELGEIVISKAAEFLASLDPPIGVSVNVSASHFTKAGFAEFVHYSLSKHALDPRRLTIEITESEDIPADTSSSAVARQLAEMGVGLAIDDFGTGYASLERLTQLAYSQLKLDRSIVAGAAGSGLEHVIAGFGKMSTESDVDVVAEGIETAEQAAMLSRLGIPLAQGYFFGRPEPTSTILRNVGDDESVTTRSQPTSRPKHAATNATQSPARNR